MFMPDLNAYRVLVELCAEQGIEIKMMGGSTKIHTTFRMTWEPLSLDKPRHVNVYRGWQPCVAYGSCGGTEITLGLTRSRVTVDLIDSDSILKLSESLKQDSGIWIK